MKSLLGKLHSRLGDLWWYSLLLFAAMRLGDLVNAVVGLWLVPRYVPQEELGAVLPLTQFASLFGIPITILVLVFTKFLAQFQAKNEQGKIKSLLCWFIGMVAAAGAISALAAKWIMPALFERIRVQNGSLIILIIATGIIGTISPVFNNALQGLKKFRTITLINLLTAPIRLVTMLLLLPVRALSGYMAGQIAPQIFSISASCFALRKHIDRKVVAVPFWKDDLKPILRYMLFCAIWAVPGTLLTSVQAMIIRQRLPDLDSAAYYMISRFAELGTYAGTTISFVLFPLAVEASVKRIDSRNALVKSTAAIVGLGLLISFALKLFGGYLFAVIPSYNPYLPYVNDLFLLSVVLTIAAAGTNFANFEAACGRFSFLWGLVFLTVKTGILVLFTAYEYLRGIIPDCAVDWLAAHRITSLNTVIWLMFACTLATSVFYIILYLKTKCGENDAS